MTDVYDVITHLETLKDEIRTGRVKSASASHVVRRMDWLGEAVALLKAQEHTTWRKISPAGIYECAKCGQNVMTSDIEAYKFCHGCGRKVKWK